jgi:hypothetical protein
MADLRTCFSKTSIAATTGLIVCGLALSSCRQPDASKSRVKFTVANRNAKNIALIVGAPNGLEGVPRDIVNVTKMFKENDLGYEIAAINNASKNQILSKAQEISPQLSPDSTVFFYFSGHGAETGELATQGYASMTLREVANSLGSKLSGGKFKRFIAVIDACYSGQNAIGSGAMFLADNRASFSLDGFLTGLTTKPSSGLFGGLGGISGQSSGSFGGSLPFEQGLVLAAARPNEESLDGGDSVGGVFTSSWMQAIQSGKSSTIQQILDNTKQITVMNSGGSHTPVWKAMPDSMLQERFDRRDNGSPSTNSSGNPSPITNEPSQPNSPPLINSAPSNSTVVTVGGTGNNGASSVPVSNPINNGFIGPSSSSETNSSSPQPNTSGTPPQEVSDFFSRIMEVFSDE